MSQGVSSSMDQQDVVMTNGVAEGSQSELERYVI